MTRCCAVLKRAKYDGTDALVLYYGTERVSSENLVGKILFYKFDKKSSKYTLVVVGVIDWAGKTKLLVNAYEAIVKIHRTEAKKGDESKLGDLKDCCKAVFDEASGPEWVDKVIESLKSKNYLERMCMNL
ncbi:hypothetical protein NHJ6243_000925 [Beauveria neobassiana]